MLSILPVNIMSKSVKRGVHNNRTKSNTQGEKALRYSCVPYLKSLMEVGTQYTQFTHICLFISFVYKQYNALVLGRTQRSLSTKCLTPFQGRREMRSRVVLFLLVRDSTCFVYLLVSDRGSEKRSNTVQG